MGKADNNNGISELSGSKGETLLPFFVCITFQWEICHTETCQFTNFLSFKNLLGDRRSGRGIHAGRQSESTDNP